MPNVTTVEYPKIDPIEKDPPKTLPDDTEPDVKISPEDVADTATAPLLPVPKMEGTGGSEQWSGFVIFGPLLLDAPNRTSQR